MLAPVTKAVLVVIAGRFNLCCVSVKCVLVGTMHPKFYSCVVDSRLHRGRGVCVLMDIQKGEVHECQISDYRLSMR